MVTTLQATRPARKRQPRKRQADPNGAATAPAATPAPTPLPPAPSPPAELALPAAATAGPQPKAEGGPALRPTQPFAMRFWIMTDSESYLMTPVRRKSPEDIGGWKLQKYSDGTTYCVADGVEGLSCDCPGCVEHGPSCAQGRGCKHMRMIRALLSAMLEH